MAPNIRRKQKTASKEESAYVEPFQNLPEKLLNFLKTQLRPSELIKSVGTTGISKSWRCASRKCNSIAQSPWLELSNEPQYHSKTQQHTFNFSFEEAGCYWWHGRQRPRYDPWKHFHSYSLWSIIRGEKLPIDYCFLNSSRDYCYWATYSFDHKKSFLFPYCSNSRGHCRFPAFVVYQLGKNQKWMKQESSQNGLTDPNDPKGQLIQFSNAIIFEGKFYALSLQGTLAVIEEIEDQFQVTRLSRRRVIPSSYSRHFIEYLVESDGEILLIFLISEGSNRTVDKVEVFKLKIEDLSWLRLETSETERYSQGLNVVCRCPQIKLAAETTVSILLIITLMVGDCMTWKVVAFPPVMMMLALRLNIQYGRSQ